MQSSDQFRMCVHPCPRYITGRDTHVLCIVCLGEEHAQSALEGAGCVHCEALSMRSLRSRLSFFREARAPQGPGPAAAEARRRSQSWGSQMNLSAGSETGSALSQPLPDRPGVSHQGAEARAAVSSPLMVTQTLQLSSSEELDVVNVEELLDVVTRAVDRLCIVWQSYKQDVRSNK